MTAKRVSTTLLVVLILVIAAGVAAGYVVGTFPEIAAITPPARTRFDPAMVERGRELAAVGNCASCHTAPNGQALAGGLALQTPFGVIYSDNITPDPVFGIGTWSRAAFIRAMRDGIDRNGAHLYPAFPYTYFARLSTDDLDALYAYLMTRRPVHQEAPHDSLSFPFNIRMLMTGWNILFLDKSPVTADPHQSSTWNRGRYLVDGLAHCGACHAPRTLLAGQSSDAALSGGTAQGWTAPALNAQSPAPVRWTERQLETYLTKGLDGHHGAAAGPMREVTASLARATPEDVQAISVYIASLMPQTPQPRPALSAPAANPTAVAIVSGVCANCHGANATIAEGRWPSLAASTTLQEASPRNVIQILRNGLPLPPPHGGAFMPAFANILSDAQIGDVANYLRTHVAGRPAWSNATRMARTIRRAEKAAP